VLAGVLFLARGERLRALVRVALGGATPVAVLAGYFAAAGSLRASVDAFLLINLRYTEPDPLLPRLEQAWEALGDSYGFSLWLLVSGLVALPVLTLVHLSAPGLRRTRVGQVAPTLGAFSLAAVVGLVWNLKDYDSWADLFPLLPLAAVGIGAVFVAITDPVPRRVAAVAGLVLVLLATAGSVHSSVTTGDDRLVTQRASVAAVFDALPEDATVTSVEAPQPLVLTGRSNPTRHQMFRGGLQHYLDDTWPGGLDGFRRDIVEEQPTLIALGTPVSDRWRAAVETEYEYIGRAPDWTWYARSSLGEDTLASLREAAGFDPADEFARPTSPADTSP
jgi:hypothetical protein